MAVGELCHGAQFHNLENEPVIGLATAQNLDIDLHLGRRDGCCTLEARLFLPYPLEKVFPFYT